MPSAARLCPDCGHEFVVERREIQTVDGELVEVQRVERRRQLPPAGPYKVGDIVNGGRHKVIAIVGDGWMDLEDVRDDCDPGDSDGWWRTHESEVEFTSRPDHRREQASAQTLDELIAIGRARNMKNPHGWARHVLAARSLRSGKMRVREVVA